MKKLLGLLLISALSARAEILFKGVMATDQAVYFFLKDDATSGSSPWLKLGGSYSGYTLVSYSSQDGILILKQGLTTLRLRAPEDQARAVREQLNPKPKAPPTKAELVKIAQNEVAKHDGWDIAKTVTKEPIWRQESWWISICTPQEQRIVKLLATGALKGYQPAPINWVPPPEEKTPAKDTSKSK
ncbi:MAG TPA: hypothetical protein VHO24_04310 [Opitutaceae bacterium]|nr:hypothetical protein [Opitutaceae bacterium]